MTFTIEHVPTLRDVVGHCYVIAGRENVVQLVDALAVERLEPEVLRPPCTSEDMAEARATRCLLPHRAAWQLASRHEGWTLVCEADFVPCLGMGGFPAFWPIEDPNAWGYLCPGSSRLPSTGTRPCLRGRCAFPVAYVINATVAGALCDLVDRRLALHDSTERSPFGECLQWRLMAKGCSPYVPRRGYGEHGALPPREQRACDARLPGPYRADNLAGRLHFLPRYSRGSLLRFAAVRTAARLHSFVQRAGRAWFGRA